MEMYHALHVCGPASKDTQTIDERRVTFWGLTPRRKRVTPRMSVLWVNIEGRYTPTLTPGRTAFNA